MCGVQRNKKPGSGSEPGHTPVGQRRFLATVSVALFLTPPCEALIVTTVLVDTGTVVTVKVTDPLPAGTVTFAGTLALFRLLLNSATTIPPAGAGTVSFRVPSVVEPPMTVDGFNVSDDSAIAAGFTVKVAVLVTPE
jgi:hypothetical protein